ncbi:uncharacterized protein DS421_13g407160 [Arachis hypogaea]|nr:uncharacterized protein DS421_13g407160 [Arachis hypogaea]
MSVVPLVCFNEVEFYHADRVKSQFNGEQPVPRDPVNVDNFLTTTGRGEDFWWPTKLREWYDRWRARFREGYRISIQPCLDYRPTQEYWIGIGWLAELDTCRDRMRTPGGLPGGGIREYGGAAGCWRDRVRPRGKRLDVESAKEVEYHQQEKYDDIPDDQGDSPPPPPPPPPSLPPPPPHLPSGSHHEASMVDEIDFEDAFHIHTIDHPTMQHTVEQFCIGREQSMGQP